MWTKNGLCLSPMMLLFMAGTMHAQEDDRAAILAMTERAFDAVHSGNPDDWRAIQLAEGTSLSVRPDPGGEAGKFAVRMMKNEEFVAGIKPDGRDFMERWTSEPTVMIRGPIAVVWGEYEFRLDGEFSHCGVDSIDFVKVDGTWKIANFMWTVEKEDCPMDT
jgi:hypothetical protein